NFLHTIHEHIIPEGLIVFMDNNYVEGSSSPITERDEQGNTYQTRSLENESMHKVLKNFPNKDFITKLLKHKAGKIEFINLEYYLYHRSLKSRIILRREIKLLPLASRKVMSGQRMCLTNLILYTSGK